MERDAISILSLPRGSGPPVLPSMDSADGNSALDGFFESLTDGDILAMEEWIPERSTEATEVSHLAPRVGVCPVEDGIPRTKCIQACAGPNVPSPHSTSLDF